jgi:hypothetical protein
MLFTVATAAMARISLSMPLSIESLAPTVK